MLLFFALFFSIAASASPQLTTYQARIVKPDGLPLESANVNFKFSVLNPAADCVLYAETFSAINMANSAGIISFALGSGVKTYPVSATTFAEVFNNSTPTLSCEAGGPPNFSPLSFDIRKVVMQFNDGAGWQTLPAMSINAVPYSIYSGDSLRLGGVSATNYVQYSTIPTCTASEALRYNGSGFNCVNVASGGGASGTITSGDVTTALGYTPANTSIVGTSFSTVTATLSSLTSSQTTLTSTVSTLSASYSALSTSMTSFTSSQWTASATDIFYTLGNVGIGTSTPVTKLDVVGGIRISMESAICAAGLAGTLRYNSGIVEYCNGTSWTAFGVSGAGILAINGLTSGSQTFAMGTTGTQPNVSSTGTVHTFNFPLASTAATTAGLISNTDYTYFTNKITSSAASIAQVLGYTPASASALGNYLVKANNLNDLASSATARSNLGLGAIALLNSVDLGTSNASGTLAVARLPSFIGDVTSSVASNTLILSNSGVTAGTYTKVTVDAKGRVTSSSALVSSDVTTALGYTPVSAAASSQWNTSGTTINYVTGNVGIGTSNPTSVVHIGGAPVATNNYGLVSIGNGPFNGSSSGFFTGNANGVVHAINTATGFAGEFAHYQNGTSDARFIVKSDGSVISGRGSANGALSSTFGGLNTANGSQAFAVGHFNNATGNYAFTSGLFDNATGDNSTAMGYSVTANSLGMTALGINNVVPTGVSTNTWQATDPIFVIGNGQGSAPASASTAMTVLKNGNVGIGATSPNVHLQVHGASTLSTIQLTTSSTGSTAVDGTRLQLSGTAFEFRNFETSPITFFTANAARMQLDSSGNLIASWTAGGFRLSNTSPNTAVSPVYSFSDDTDSGLFSPAMGSLAFSTDAVERMRIDSFGKVGIGTSSPVTKLDVSGGVRISMESAACAVSYAGTLRYNSGNVEYCNGTTWTAFGTAGAVTSSSIAAALSYTPANSATVATSFTELTNSINTVGTSVTTLSSTVNNLSSSYTSLAASVSGMTSSQWITSGTTIHYLTGKVGIGRTNPTAALTVSGSIVTGDASSTASGLYAVAMGANNVATGINSVAIGGSNSAVNNFSTAIGNGNTASGHSSVALGFDNTTTGFASFAVGDTSIADQYGAMALGVGVEARGYASIAMGELSVASGSYSFSTGQGSVAGDDYAIAMGSYSTATGYNSVAIGESAQAFNQYSIAMGTSSVASGFTSVAIGKDVTAHSYAQISLGRQNMPKGGENPNSWIWTDPIFAIGNGTGTGASRSTALMILKNGNTGIGLTAPTAFLHVKAGTSSVAALKLSSGTLLTSPESGTIEYDGSNLYFTDGTSIRRTIATATASGSYANVGSLENSSGNINLVPNATGSVIVSATTASTNSQTGALIVKGGLGVAGNIYSSGTIMTSANMQGASITATSGIIAPYIYGSTQASGDLVLDSTTNTTKGNVLLAPGGGNVGIGAANPSEKLHVSGGSSGTAGTIARFKGNSSWGSIDFYTMNTNTSFIGDFMVMNAMGWDTSVNALRFLTNGNERVRVDNQGKMGIGTAAPVAKLDVSGSIRMAYDATTCNSAFKGTMRFSSTDNIFEMCDGTAWNISASADLIPASSIVLMSACPVGWTNNGLAAVGGQGAVTCNGITCSLCQAPSASLVPANSNMLMESCPSGWTTMGKSASMGRSGYTLGGSIVDFVTCQSPAIGSVMPKGSRVIMQFCPAAWNDLGNTGPGQILANCGAISCRVCEVPGGVASPRVLYGGTASSSAITGSEVSIIGGPGGSISGSGGSVNIRGGMSSEGAGGSVVINAGAASTTTNTSYAGASIQLTAGNGVVSGMGGVISLSAGASADGTYEDIELQPYGGRVGIGTTNAEQRLHVAGNSMLLGSLQTNISAYASGGIRLTGVGGASQEAISFWGGNSGGGAAIAFRRDDNLGSYLDFYTDNTGFGNITHAATLNNFGNFGIGTASPTTRLHVANSSTVTNAVATLESTGAGGRPYMKFRAEGTDMGYVGYGSTAQPNLILMNYVSGPTYLGTNSLIRMSITSSGAVGIGTQTPENLLDVAGTAQVNYLRVDATDAVSEGGEIQLIGSPTYTNIQLDNFQGNFRVHTLAAGKKMQVLGGTMSVEGTGGTNYFAAAVGIGNPSPAVALDVTGDIRGTGTVATWSDVRTKKNIKVIPDSLNKILHLRGVGFDWRTDEFPDKKFKTTPDIGVIAQEVEKVFPEVVKTSSDGYKSVGYAQLVAPLIEAVKELYYKVTGVERKVDRAVASIEAKKADKTEVDALKAENAELKQRLERLEKMMLNQQK